MRDKRRVRRAAIAIALAIGAAISARASELSDDLHARRARVMDRLGADALLIVFSAPPARYSLDINYEYRQDSNLYYLTGIAQEETTLVLMPGNASRRAVLFVKDRNAALEHWYGRRLSHEEATARSGIDTVLAASQFDAFVSAMLAGNSFGPVDAREAARFFDALAAGRARVALPLESGRRPTDALTPTLDFAQRIRDRFVGFAVADASPLLAEARVIKTPLERALLTRSVDIASDAQRAGMRAAHPGAHEYEVKAAIEAVHRARGAQSTSYPSIVGSGPNATVIHYPGGDRVMQPGDLLLADAGCNYEYAAADITRTYPVSGTFSPLQRDLYSLVLQAQDEGVKAAVPGRSLRDVHRTVVDVMKAGLLRLGLITDATGEQYRLWFDHGSTHYIGTDVHDVGDPTRPLAPGMAFTIEPGVYVRQSALDALPRTPENDALIAKVQPAVTKYGDIGVRVEDSFLLEETGLRRLSASVPRTIEEIEEFLKHARSQETAAGRRDRRRPARP